MKQKFYDTAVKQEKAVLVGVMTPHVTDEQEKEYLEELEFLVATAGGETITSFTQKLQRPDRATFVGSGKLEDIKAFVIEEEIDMVVFDDELSPSQLRNIERELQVKILDRNNLILDIFANRAQTAQAKTQVELAQLQYLLPRLTRLWTHLERQKGGIGMRGPGESQIETDRRLILDKISLLKEKLKQIDKQNETQRKNRNQMVRAALVGYTNVGKSTIMNMISKSDVFAENKLFATLDTTVRKVVIENVPFLLSDTVGFIRKLPHHLVECFKSTLDEVREADILVHVVDVSHPNFEDQIRTVNETLKDIGAIDKKMITVFNKIDAFKPEEHQLEPQAEPLTLDDFKHSWMAKNNSPAIFISATKKENVDEFRDLLYNEVKAIHTERYPYDQLLY
ncbi:GTP-binding protein HflX [Mucilaginibacter lappiensis]|uniref:GTPase HflX n=1 Tax=Mucilaginibacter lappiensis TaxID=354630 RepID=A0ABR6PKM2_9SPHI|nr:GTPase HflX [Mucilaginibacter lappiensis]MBB6110321.1 GTP-binding protein HflX [Mucilaginibacter lappiensis]SIR30331.1 GTP-binding protein HflX [Mucilaginibacter lappiensis]